NINIVKELNNIDGLPQELHSQNELLLQYCDLRIRHNEVVIKTIAEDTDAYTAKIEQLTSEMNQVIEALTTQNQ
ncbi:MAG TPA: hypothetical protein VJ937_12350, partial [Salinivirga sp.]|uniref:hypothetical protein n=1 Tax=Salinivirga sp. TaxID=1970192 RepID=UPI002B48DA99